MVADDSQLLSPSGISHFFDKGNHWYSIARNESHTGRETAGLPTWPLVVLRDKSSGAGKG
jgi:hypothetical protein